MIKGRYKDRSGAVVGKLTVISFNRATTSGGYWDCLCECGNHTTVLWGNLARGHTKSCGCFSSQASRERATTHGMRDIPEYGIWHHIKSRCTNPHDAGYRYYGGRGITICDSWATSFEAFISDMGRRPSKELTLERIDNNKGYCPENCKWATRTEQSRNRRSNSEVLFRGEPRTIISLSEEFGIPYTTLWNRIRSGEPIETAIHQTKGRREKRH